MGAKHRKKGKVKRGIRDMVQPWALRPGNSSNIAPRFGADGNMVVAKGIVALSVVALVFDSPENKLFGKKVLR